MACLVELVHQPAEPTVAAIVVPYLYSELRSKPHEH